MSFLSELFIKSAFGYCSIIHFLPTIGVTGSASLQNLYGVIIQEKNELLMMRHRAVMFGIIGGILGLAIVRKPLRKFAYLAGLMSMFSYLILVTDEGIQTFTPQIQRVFWIDVIGVAWLGGAAVLSAMSSTENTKKQL